MGLAGLMSFGQIIVLSLSVCACPRTKTTRKILRDVYLVKLKAVIAQNSHGPAREKRSNEDLIENRCSFCFVTIYFCLSFIWSFVRILIYLF
uniref:Uncharacterized protein n=1 Tax=Strigamia maritima TaxID=126957 RepID=T1JJ37_STRMM